MQNLREKMLVKEAGGGTKSELSKEILEEEDHSFGIDPWGDGQTGWW